MPLKCEPGRHANELKTECIECEPGYFCIEGEKKQCDEGTYSNSSAFNCTDCEAGYYCPKEMLNEIHLTRRYKCDHTQYSAQKSLNCYDCNNYYGVDFDCEKYGNAFTSEFCKSQNRIIQNELGEKPSCVQCDNGMMPDENGLECVACSVGLYCSGDVIEKCEPGSSCTVTGLSRPQDCQRGFNCAVPSAPVLCQNGTYSNHNKTLCIDCEPGGYCQNGISTKCDKQRCNETAMVEPLPCEKGYECFDGIPKPCGYLIDIWSALSGQYNDKENGECKVCQVGSRITSLASIECQVCEDGATCSQGLKRTCHEGYMKSFTGKMVNDENDYNCDLCPKGFYCQSEGIASPCPSGTYTEMNGAMQEDDCIKCPLNHYCPRTDPYDPIECNDQVLYCPAGTEQPYSYSDAKIMPLVTEAIQLDSNYDLTISDSEVSCWTSCIDNSFCLGYFYHSNNNFCFRIIPAK